MKYLFFTLTLAFTFSLFVNINPANAEACTNQDEICDAAFICNYYYRAAFEPDPTPVNEEIFNDMVKSDGNEKVRQSCKWQIGFVMPAGSPIYDK